MSTIRELVLEIEAAWEQQLGGARFASLRELLVALNEVAPGPGPRDG